MNVILYHVNVILKAGLVSQSSRYGRKVPAGRALVAYWIDPEVCVGCGLCRRKCPVAGVLGEQNFRVSWCSGDLVSSGTLGTYTKFG